MSHAMVLVDLFANLVMEMVLKYIVGINKPSGQKVYELKSPFNIRNIGLNRG